jgi:hypothetical protein
MEYATPVDRTEANTLSVAVGTRTYLLQGDEVHRYQETIARCQSVEEALSYALNPFRVDL